MAEDEWIYEPAPAMGGASAAPPQPAAEKAPQDGEWVYDQPKSPAQDEWVYDQQPPAPEPGFTGLMKRAVHTGWNQATSGAAIGLHDMGLISGEAAASQIATDAQDIAGIEIPKRVVQGAAAYKALDANPDAGISDNVAFWYNNPAFAEWIIGQGMGQSAGAMAAQLAAGTAVGAAAGPGALAVGAGAATVGLASGVQDYWSSLLDAMKDGGYDTTDPKSIENAYANPEFVSKMREAAAKHGVSVGVFDALSSLIAPGVGGRAAGLVTKADSILARATQHAAAFGVEEAMTAAGEAGGQLWATGTINIPSLGAEVVGDAGPGAVDVAFQTAFGGERGTAAQTPISGPEAFGATPTPGLPSGGPGPEPPQGEAQPQGPPELFVRTADQAAQEGRTMFGFTRPDDGGLTPVRQSYQETETLMGGGENRGSRMVAVEPGQTVMSAEDFVTGRKGIDPGKVKYEGSSPDFAKGLMEDAVKASTPQAARGSYLAAVKAGARLQPPPGAETGLFLGDAQKSQVLGWSADPIHADLAANHFGDLSYLHAANPNRTMASKAVPWFDLKTLKQRLGNRFYPEFFKGPGPGDASKWAPHVSGNPQTVQEFLQRVGDPGQDNTSIQLWAKGEVQKGKLQFDLNTQTFTSYGNFVGVSEPEMTAALKAATMHGMPEVKTIGSPFLSRLPPIVMSTLTEADLDPSVVRFHQGVATVMYEGGSPSELRAQKAVLAGAKVISELKRRLNIPNKIVIHYINAGSPRVSQKADPNTDQAYERYITGENNASLRTGMDGTLFINVGGAKVDPAQIYSVLGHEMGHAVAFTRFAGASAEVRAQIFAAYRRFLLAHQRQPTREFFQRRRAGSHTWLDERKAEGGRIGGLNQAYGVQFEEWFAEQVSRWLQTDRRPMGAVARHFRETANAVLSVLRAFWAKFPNATFRPEREMEAWLGSMWEGQTQVNWAPVARAWFQRDTTIQNERWFGEGAQQMSAESVGLRNVIGALGPGPRVEEGPGDVGPPSQGPTPNSATSNASWIGAHVDKFNWFHKWVYNIQQLADINPRVLPLQIYRSTIGLMQNMANKIMGQSDARIRDWRALGADMGGRLTAFIVDLDQGAYLTAAERKAGVRRQPTPLEQFALAQQHGLSAEAVKVYKDDATKRGIFYDFQQVIDRTEALAIREAMKVTNPAARAVAIAEAQRRSAALKAAPYFPHTRFGSWAVTVRVAGKLTHFETRESKREQQALKKDLEAQYPGASVVTSTIPEDVRQFVGMPPWLMDKLMTLPGLTTAQKDWMQNLRNEVAPAVSMRKHLMQRKNYAGFSREGMRVYAKYFFHHGRQMARLTYQEQLADQVKTLQDAGKNATSSADLNALTRMGQYLSDHLAEVMNPSKDWALLRSVAAMFHLGFVPAAAALNLMQVPMVTGPYLGAKFGDARAAAALMWAAKDFRAFYKQGAIATMPGPQFRALAQAIEQGFISESFAADLAAIAQGGRVGSMGFGQSVRERWVAFSEKAMKMFQLAEEFNRRTTFLAGWKLGMEADLNSPHMQELGRKYFLEIQNMQKQGGLGGPMSPQEIMAFVAGKSAVDNTQYTFDQTHRPRFMKGQKGAMFTFYGYTLNTLLTMWNNKTDVMPRMLLTMLFMAGPLGVIPDDIEELVNFIIRKSMGKDFNVEREAREIVSGIVGADWADSLLLGASRNSFGIPWLMDMAGVSWAPHLDMSRSVGLSRLLPLNVTGLLEPGPDFNKVIRNTTEGVAGAAFGPGFALMEALGASDLNWYDFKRWEKALPRAARGMERAIRNGYEGAERDRNYNAMLDFDYTDHQHFAELTAMALGFNPTRRAQFYDRLRGQMEVDAFWQTTREGLMRRAFQSKALKMEDWSGVLDDIKDYNSNVPDPKRRITSKSLKESLSRRLRQKAAKEAGRPGSLDTIYPEVERHSVR